MEIKLSKGKYTLCFDEKTGQLKALRYGEPWQDLRGNKFVYCLGALIEELETERRTIIKRLNYLNVGGKPITELDSVLCAYVNKDRDYEVKL